MLLHGLLCLLYPGLLVVQLVVELPQQDVGLLQLVLNVLQQQRLLGHLYINPIKLRVFLFFSFPFIFIFLFSFSFPFYLVLQVLDERLKVLYFLLLGKELIPSFLNNRSS